MKSSFIDGTSFRGEKAALREQETTDKIPGCIVLLCYGIAMLCSPLFPIEHRSNETVNLAQPYLLISPQDKDPKKADNLTCLLLGLLGLALLLEDLLDDLLLLNEESTNDTVADAVAAAGTTVGTLDSLLGLGELSVLAGAEGRDLCDSKVPSAYVFRRVATVAVVHNPPPSSKSIMLGGAGPGCRS